MHMKELPIPQETRHFPTGSECQDCVGFCAAPVKRQAIVPSHEAWQRCWCVTLRFHLNSYGSCVRGSIPILFHTWLTAVLALKLKMQHCFSQRLRPCAPCKESAPRFTPAALCRAGSFHPAIAGEIRVPSAHWCYTWPVQPYFCRMCIFLSFWDTHTFSSVMFFLSSFWRWPCIAPWLWHCLVHLLTI